MIAVIPNKHTLILMTDIFISYSRSDQQWVAKLARALEDVGYSVWWDTQLLAGEDFMHIIPEELEKARCVVVVWSKASVQRKWVRSEATRADNRGVLIPVRCETADIPMPLDLLHAEDMQGWNGKPEHLAFQRLLKSVARYCSPTDSCNMTEPEAELKPDTSPPRQSRAGWWLAGVVVTAVAGGSYAYLKNTVDHQIVVSKPPLPSEPVAMQLEPASKPEPLPEPKSTEEKTVASKSPATSSPASSTSAEKLIAGRYLDNGDGTVTDTQTKLMWKKCSEGQSGNTCSGEAATYKWDDAMSRFGQDVSFAGYSDWRMSTKEELRSLVYCSNSTPASVAWDKSCSNGGNAGDYQSPTINVQAFPNTPESWYWSSTPKDASDAWFVGFGDGNVYWYYRYFDVHVRLVRSG